LLEVSGRISNDTIKEILSRSVHPSPGTVGRSPLDMCFWYSKPARVRAFLTGRIRFAKRPHNQSRPDTTRCDPRQERRLHAKHSRLDYQPHG
jgi:hypothetical protein